MIALHQRGQGIQEHLRAIQRIHVKLGFVFVLPVIRIKHHRRNVLVMAFSADAATFRNGHGVSNHNSADVADAKNSQSGFDRRYWYHPVSGVRQNGIPDGSQHPLCGDRKD
jgi:hypothetical protein